VWGRTETHAKFWFGTQKERDYLEDAGVCVKVTVKLIVKKYWAQKKNKCGAVVSRVMNSAGP
jgi:hypothetical protein